MPGPEHQKTLPAPATAALAAKALTAEQQVALLELRTESRIAMGALDLAAADAQAMHALAHARQRRLPRERQREAHLAGTVNLS